MLTCFQVVIDTEEPKYPADYLSAKIYATPRGGDLETFHSLEMGQAECCLHLDEDSQPVSGLYGLHPSTKPPAPLI